MISVIMLTYNREKLVARAIESILRQTLTNFEYIIVDNGSSDNSGAIAKEYAAKDARIRIISGARGNIGSGRNTGLDEAKGDYITFIDDDDWCEPDYLEFLYGMITEAGAEVAICGADDKVFDEKLVMNAEEALITLFWRKKYNVAFPAKLFKASLFEGIRFSETTKYDDIELMPRILGRAQQIVYHGLPKYTFERHEGNNSAWTENHSLLDAATLDEYLRVYQSRTKWLCEQYPASKPAWRYFEWSFMLSMVEKVKRLKLCDCEPACAAMERELRACGNEFLQCGLALDFEEEWMKEYVGKL